MWDESSELTFIATLSPCEVRMRGANSEALYASRLYLELVANNAIAGGVPVESGYRLYAINDKGTHHRLS